MAISKTRLDRALSLFAYDKNRSLVRKGSFVDAGLHLNLKLSIVGISDRKRAEAERLKRVLDPIRYIIQNL